MDAAKAKGQLEGLLGAGGKVTQRLTTLHNAIALQCDVPLDVAKSMVFLCSAVVPAIIGARERGDLMEKHALSSALAGTYAPLAEILGVPREKLDRAVSASVKAVCDVLKEFSEDLDRLFPEGEPNAPQH